MIPPAVPAAQPPVEVADIKLGVPSGAAGGLQAVAVTTGLTLGAMGAVRGAKLLLEVNQKDGFDCQSCAWPSPDGDRHTFEFCENGVKAVADEATPRRITAEFFAQHTVAELAAQSDHWLNAQGRLTAPMVLRAGASHYEAISWDDAFALIADALRALPTPDAAAFYTSGRTSNEAAFLWQLFARQLGTNNLPDCSNMCHESSGVALGETIGIGKGTVKLEDFEKAEAIFVIGQNPGTNHPRMLTALEAAKARGAKIVSVNPLPEVGTERFKNPQDFLNPLKAFTTLLGDGARLADLWLQPRIGGDLPLFKGIMKDMLAVEEAGAVPGGVFDHACPHPRLRRARGRFAGDLVGRDCVGERRGAGGDPRGGADRDEIAGDDLLLGHGSDAAAECGGDDSDHRKPSPVARRPGAAGGRGVSRTRSLECARRSHDGDF